MDLSNTVILDTETTGLSKKDEVIEISIVDGKTGLVLLDTLVKPTCVINPHASAVHGITEEMVATAPTWAEIHDLVVRLLSGVTMLAYQVDFDLRLMKQSAKAHGLRLGSITSVCAMRWLHSYLLSPKEPKLKWPKLTDAAEQFGVTTRGTAHRALADVHMTRDVILAVRAEDQLDRLYRPTETPKKRRERRRTST